MVEIFTESASLMHHQNDRECLRLVFADDEANIG